AWTGEAGGRVKLSIPVKSYEQPGRAMEVLRLAIYKEFHEPFRKVKARLAGIEPVGIGILTSSVAKIFPQHLVVNDLEGLAGSFYRKLSGVLGV
ncbi:MAG: hypothetical protein JRI22_20430, partial [Deltaproteobacteria bacterium]|nr:hypothetical protein [Deltaproteobacteria bacterium]